MHAQPNSMLRFATATDAEIVAEIQIETWRAAYAGIVPADQLAALSKPKRAEGWRHGISADPRGVLLAVKGDRANGFIAFGRGREGENSDGEIYALYIRPDCWRSGIGRQLIEEAERELWAGGFNQAILWVLERNLPARAFYERLGYAVNGQTKETAFGEISLVELRYLKMGP
jgi:GNAT superfamily N-acetyltransferase